MAGQSSTGYSENEITGNGLSGPGLSGDGFSRDGLSGAGISAAELRDVMGHFATGVTVVTSVDAEGKPVGTTANAVTSLSLDPPLVIVCFDLGSLTLRAVRGHGAFVVNVLAAPQLHLSRNFARRGLAAAWDGVRHRRGPTGSPRLEDVLAVLECTVEHALPGGDHKIIVGRVRHAETSANPNGPLVFFRGSYASLTDQDLPACG
jgi:flavin reductase (DIM6/NTAB) family NADH-FMN oxidoreductase RutF